MRISDWSSDVCSSDLMSMADAREGANRDRYELVERSLFLPEHDAFRETVRRFVEKELVPQHGQWEKEGVVPREVWAKAADLGMLCPSIPPEYGGLGADCLYVVVVIAEITRGNVTGPGFMAPPEMVAPYILAWGSEALKDRKSTRLNSSH